VPSLTTPSLSLLLLLQAKDTASDAASTANKKAGEAVQTAEDTGRAAKAKGQDAAAAANRKAGQAAQGVEDAGHAAKKDFKQGEAQQRAKHAEKPSASSSSTTTTTTSSKSSGASGSSSGSSAPGSDIKVVEKDVTVAVPVVENKKTGQHAMATSELSAADVIKRAVESGKK
jgi:hypothetical protein